jgi:hypothetical protein
MNVLGSTPDETRDNIQAIARAMSPLPNVNGMPVFPVEMIVDMGKAARSMLPADELIRELTSNKELGKRLIAHTLGLGTSPQQLWLNYNVWRVLRGQEPM